MEPTGIPQALVLLDYFGIGVFAVSGALLAAERRQTLVTFVFFAVATGVGGGTLRDLLIGLWQRAWVFLRRAGTIIFMVTVVLWLLLSFPKAAPGESQVDASIAGQLSEGLAVVVEPIGFNREIALSLIPAMAAREVAVSSLATTYAVDAEDEEQAAEGLIPKLQARWTDKGEPPAS